jgi:lysyl endopeptidase
MKHNYYLHLVVILAAYFNNINAQVLTRTMEQKTFSRFVKFDADFNAPVFEMLPVDVEKARLENIQESGKNIPLKYGIPIDVNIGIEKGVWVSSPYFGGRVWKLAIKSKNAASLNLFFDKLFLPEGAELYVYNSDKTKIFGPVTSTQNSQNRNLATTILKGDAVEIILFEPIRNKGKTQLHISHVVHGFTNIGDKDNPSGQAIPIGPCHNNIACPEWAGFQNEADAVALLIIPRSGRACSGTLLNNACNNLTPNILTAFHCIDAAVTGIKDDRISTADRLEVNKYTFVFNFRSATCAGVEGDNTSISFMGGDLISSSQPTDFALTRLYESPKISSGIRFSGWDRSGNMPTQTIGIHHPGGHVMKVSLDDDSPTISSYIMRPGTPDNAHWRILWDDGSTAPISSGSGLFNEQNKLIGQLRGGFASCSTTDSADYYGRFSESWTGGGTITTRLEEHLSDDPSVTQTNTVGIPSFTLPDVICGFEPLGINWNGMTNMNLTGGTLSGVQGSSQGFGIEPMPNFSGIGFLNLHYRPSGITCNTPLIISKEFQVGPQTPQTSFIDEGGDCFGWLTVNNPLPNHTYSWKITRGPNWYTYYNTGSTVFLNNWGSNYAWISYELTTTNACGSTTVEGNGNLTGCNGPFLKGNDNGVAALLSKTYKPTLLISPTPATNEVTLNIKDMSPILMHTLCDVNIVNQMGQTVMSQKLIVENSIRLDISQLTNGFYVAQVKGENGLFLSQKLMVNKK